MTGKGIGNCCECGIKIEDLLEPAFTSMRLVFESFYCMLFVLFQKFYLLFNLSSLTLSEAFWLIVSIWSCLILMLFKVSSNSFEACILSFITDLFICDLLTADIADLEVLTISWGLICMPLCWIICCADILLVKFLRRIELR